MITPSTAPTAIPTNTIHLSPLPIAATFSKDPSFWGQPFEPSFVLEGERSHVLGSDGRTYLDWVSALGANLLGYNHYEFTRQVQRQVTLGAGFSLPHVLEQFVAEKLAILLGSHVPGWSPEGINLRFGKTGTDATTMAIRLARAVTGREVVLSSGYHGWGSWSVGKTPPAWGVVPEGVVDFPFNDLEAVAKLLDSYASVAAVILEQPMQDPLPGYYAGLRKICDEHGALLIIDEVVTGMRFALGGACELFGIEPDLACYGKALGNGHAISCMVGRKEYFDWFRRSDPVFVSSTHFGNAVDLAAANAVLDIWGEADTMHLWRIGLVLKVKLQALGYTVIGHGPRSLLQFENPYARAYFIAGMRDRGILMNRPNIPNLAHTPKDVQETIEAAEEVAAEMRRVDVTEAMRGRLPRVLFEGR